MERKYQPLMLIEPDSWANVRYKCFTLENYNFQNIIWITDEKTFPLLESASFLQKIQNPSSIYKLTEREIDSFQLSQMAFNILNQTISFFQLDYTIIVKRFQIIMRSKFNFFNFLLLLQKIPTFSALRFCKWVGRKIFYRDPFQFF